MAYDWKTDLPGVFSRHADTCAVREGEECSCGPLGYRSSIRHDGTGYRSVSPMYATLVEARTWQHEQVLSQDASRGLALDLSDTPPEPPSAPALDEPVSASPKPVAQPTNDQAPRYEVPQYDPVVQERLWSTVRLLVFAFVLIALRAQPRAAQPRGH